MGTEERPQKPHLVCIPVPAQGHINPMFKLAKLLHYRGFHITFVHTEFNYQRLLKSRGLNHLKGLNDFRFETIPDGLPPDNKRGVLDLPAMCTSMPKYCVTPFRNLILKLNASLDVPPVSCIISDGVMGLTLQVAQELGLPEIVFYTLSGCGLLGYMHYRELVERGYVPLKDESYISNGYLESKIDWIPAMKGIRLWDLPAFLRTTDPNDIMYNYNIEQIEIASKANGLILNTFNDLEDEVLDDIKSKFPQLYTIGPLSLLSRQMPETELTLFESNLWEQDMSCIEWLDKRDPKSVLYVNFGSLAIMTTQQLSEFAWGLANSKYPFLWIIRSDLVDEASEVLSEVFLEEIKGRGLLIGWCPQEEVLKHRSIGCFLTHCGWNSTIESISEGVPMICWPYFAEQPTNCFYICNKWRIGMEINCDAKREEVEVIVKELMEGAKGEEMKNTAMDFKKKAIEATRPKGSSYINFERLIKDVLHLGLHPSAN
ncbi:hypothetical protein AQUCO_01000172v1 [Aquilegia coerulea]|uniref:Glycosyltransferase n=1 Tax=Aquilegia coerulea TaxID=218851 RepID=A0A2G5E8K1_AQUCA|nr:hypothetical protein AQUCO_01000172v1 [Aquilegia coerulea]